MRTYGYCFVIINRHRTQLQVFYVETSNGSLINKQLLQLTMVLIRGILYFSIKRSLMTLWN